MRFRKVGIEDVYSDFALFNIQAGEKKYSRKCRSFDRWTSREKRRAKRDKSKRSRRASEKADIGGVQKKKRRPIREFWNRPIKEKNPKRRL